MKTVLLALTLLMTTTGFADSSNVWMRCQMLRESKSAFKLEVLLKGTPGSSQTAEVIENGKSVFSANIDLKESASAHLTVFTGTDFKLDVNRAMAAGKDKAFISSVYYPQSNQSASTPILSCKTNTDLARLNAGADWSRSLASFGEANSQGI
jgi:hypothetical protein